MNSIKNAVESMNSNKNKLNDKIILIFYPNPNAHSESTIPHLIWVTMALI